MSNIRQLVKDQWEEDDLTPGYNYVVYSVRVCPPSAFSGQLWLKRDSIEKEVQRTMRTFKFLPKLCLVRKRSVLIPIPYGTPLNCLTDAITGLMNSDSLTSVALPN